jgi:pantetheine-phosphate adenylyltransferase
MASEAIYPGSFDPLTNGHISIINRGLRVFDRLTIAVANNPTKAPLFSVDERKDFIRVALGKERRVSIDSFDGLLTDYARQKGVHVILRGLRAVSDFDYEFQLANMNRKLLPDFESVFMMTGEDYFYISSRLVREVAQFGGDVAGLVPPNVLAALNRHFKTVKTARGRRRKAK